MQTKDKKCDTRCSSKTLYIVGTGPGSIEYMSQRACAVLKSVDVVAGYTTYIDIIMPLIEGKKIINTGMTKEVDRVRAAVDTVKNGQSCAIVSSGDPGIYAMSGLAFEICKKEDIKILPPSSTDKCTAKNEIVIEVIPGIPALSSGASLLGAPLTHDFAVISLSDLLTPWELIEKRIDAAAAADFVIVIYNPKSRKRNWQLNAAGKIVLKYRDKNTPVGIVRSAMRPEQKVDTILLKDLDTADVNMQTTVFIGNSNSFIYHDYIVTPRGYTKKYDI